MSNYEIDLDKETGVCSVKVKGDLCAENCSELRAVLKKQIDLSDKANEFVVDIADIGVIDSAGIGLLIALHNSLKAKNGKLVLSQVSEPIYQFMTTLRLHSHFEICPADSSKES